MVIKCYVGSKAIREYEHDLNTGVSLAAIEHHAEKQIDILRKKDTFFSRTAAEQIEQWLIHKLNP